MNLTLADFQREAINKLMDSMIDDSREVILKSCTGSGKTIILTHFIDEYLKSFTKTVFVWLTPGKGELEEQSKEKMDRYIHNISTKTLSDVMTSGFSDGDTCFINWEMLANKKNNSMKESEHTNFTEYVDKAHIEGLKFIIIVDESHQNNTAKSDEIISYFKTDKIIYSSATPINVNDAKLIEIPEQDVMAEGLIKKIIVINEDFPQKIEVDNEINFLLEKALEKQLALKNEFLQRDININPLILVQIPNKSDDYKYKIETYFESKHIAYENELLAVWLSNEKEHNENISANESTPVALIMKQAVSTGWDCPRAYILVKLRDNMDEIFQLQTIGRIRRMPEAMHYDNYLLDSCYIYTLDEKFIEEVIKNFDNATEVKTLLLKQEHKNFKLISELKSNINYNTDAIFILNVIYSHFKNVYKITDSQKQNKNKLESYGYNFSDEITKHTISGTLSKINLQEIKSLNKIAITVKATTSEQGRAFHQLVWRIARKIYIDYDKMSTILRHIFVESVAHNKRILNLSNKEIYTFVINNYEKLKEDIGNAMTSIEATQENLKNLRIIEKEFVFPETFKLHFEKNVKVVTHYTKNVYDGYLSSIKKPSQSERLFEKYCQVSDNVDWFYKNGDKGIEFFSIVYEDKYRKQHSFFPDYIVYVKGDIWIIETKGGFSASGKSEDIDPFSSIKFEWLKKYLIKHNLKGGFVREDKNITELCICTENYNKDIQSEDWKLLSSIF